MVAGDGARPALSMVHYQTGGKTGTAQRFDPTCHCYKGYVTSYVSFAPLNDPSIMTYVVINNPAHGDTGTATAAPVVRDIMTYALPRYGVLPDQTDWKSAGRQYHLPFQW